MKTEIFISKDQLMVGTLILIPTRFAFDGYLKYNNIYSNQEVDCDNSQTDKRNVDDIYDQAKTFCDNSKYFNLISY